MAHPWISSGGSRMSQYLWASNEDWKGFKKFEMSRSVGAPCPMPLKMGQSKRAAVSGELSHDTLNALAPLRNAERLFSSANDGYYSPFSSRSRTSGSKD